jgi:hypothetical protein
MNILMGAEHRPSALPAASPSSASQVVVMMGSTNSNMIDSGDKVYRVLKK